MDGNIPDQFEKMIEDGSIKFHACDPGDLEPWGQVLVRQFLGTHKINWQLGDRKVGNAYVLKLDDPKLHYLDIYPDTQQFMWCGEGHHNGIHPDEALVYLLRKDYGVDVTINNVAPGVQTIRIDKKPLN